MNLLELFLETQRKEEYLKCIFIVIIISQISIFLYT